MNPRMNVMVCLQKKEGAGGNDGTGGGGIFLGKKLAMAPSGFRIKRWCGSQGPGEGHLGKIG
jgi:hypothetical protein